MKNKNLNTKFQNLKSNHAITLIALIITIVVMLILVAVTLTIALGDNGVVTTAKKASNEYEIAQKKDELIYYTAEYSNATGYRISEEALTKIAEISIETGISPDKFMVFHYKYAIDKNKAEGTTLPEEYIFYNWNATTIEEIEYLEGEEYTIEEPIDGLVCDMSNRAFVMDFNGDGWMNESDYQLISEIWSYISNDFGWYSIDFWVYDDDLFDDNINESKNQVYANVLNLTDGYAELYTPILFSMSNPGFSYDGGHASEFELTYVLLNGDKRDESGNMTNELENLMQIPYYNR